MNKLGTATLCVLTAVSGWATAQEVEPDEPGIILPPMLLEVEDLQVESVEAALPEDDIMLRPEISVPLPAADDLYLPEETFDIPYPDQVAGGSLSYEPVQPQRQTSVFSEGQIGLGTMNHVIGDVSIFKLGAAPRFSLRFYHEKQDGYLGADGFREAGSGFYHSEDVLDGSFSYESDGLFFEAEGNISEISEGLQGVGNYESRTNRYLSADAVIGYTIRDFLVLSGTLTPHYVSQVLEAATPVSVSEFGIRPELSATLQFTSFEIGLNGSYHLLGYAGSQPVHKLGGLLHATLFLPPEYRITLEGGVKWTDDNTLDIPVVLSAEGAVGNVMRFRTAGGHRVTENTYFDTWANLPLVDISGPLSNSVSWFWDADTQFTILDNLTLNASLGFSATENSVTLSSSPDDQTGLFGVSQVQDPEFDLGAELRVTWEIISSLTLAAGSTVDFLGAPPLGAPQTYELTLDYEHPMERFGVNLDSAYELYPEIQMPRLSLGGYYRISDGVMFELGLRDLLSPILPNGRRAWGPSTTNSTRPPGPYIEPGFHAVLRTKISL